MLALRDEGRSVDEIARVLRRSPDHIDRIIEWSAIPRSGPAQRRKPRALERRVLSLRDQGATHDEIGGKFGRSAEFIRRVEGLAHYRRAIEILAS